MVGNDRCETFSQFFPQVALVPAPAHHGEMREGRVDEYSYLVERDLAGAGRTVWRWTVCRDGGGAALASGTSIRSEDDAGAAALRAIARLRKSSIAAS